MSRTEEGTGFATGSATSEAAARSVSAAILRATVLRSLASHPEGMTTDEIEEHTGLSHQTCSPRVVELAAKGVIVKTEIRRPTRAGRQAFVYALTDSGRVAASMAASAPVQSDTREQTARIRCRPDEMRAFFAAAEAIGVSFSAWARMTLLAAAKTQKAAP